MTWNDERIEALKENIALPNYAEIAKAIIAKCPGKPLSRNAVRHKVKTLNLKPHQCLPGHPQKRKADPGRKNNVRKLGLGRPGDYGSQPKVDRTVWERLPLPADKVTLSPGVGAILPQIGVRAHNGRAQEPGMLLVDLGSHDCRWPLDGPEIRFCGHLQQEGSSYCAEHRAIGTVPVKPLKSVKPTVWRFDRMR